MTRRRSISAILLGHVIASALLLCALAGCHSWSASNDDNENDAHETAGSATKVEKPVAGQPLRVVRGTPEDEEITTGPGEDGELSAHGAADLAWRAVEESVEFHPTLAVWILDASPTSQRLLSQTTTRLKNHYLNLKQSAQSSSEDSGTSAQLQTAVLLYANEGPKFLLQEPSPNVQEVAETLDSTSVISSEEEHTLGALRAAVDKYAAVQQQGRNILFFVITDEAGEDWEAVDQLLLEIKRRNIAVYVIGSPAPFGRMDLNAPTFGMPASKGANATPPARYGPESRGVEFVRFDAPFRGSELAILDSGFGPFALERLCRASDGVFLAVRPKYISDYVGVLGDTWPSPYARRFPREVMRDYQPDYVTEEEYQKLLSSNEAARALVQAAAIKPPERMLGPQLEFVKRDEAQFSGDLGKAQQLAARIEPGLNKIHDLLKSGEAARDQLSSKRWQAGYDLAMGQISVSKARVEGYNAMLARAKRGMAFKNPQSKSWLLEPAEEHADSTLEKLATRGREYLERVMREHPNTPWAALAEHELSSPTGWTWVER